MGSYRNLWLGIFGLLLLLAAAIIDRSVAESGLVWKTSEIINFKTAVSLLKELAFAILIALLVIITIEHESRKADRETADLLRREIANDVFNGVFSRDLSPEYVDAAISLHLKPALVRNYVKIDYAFENLPEEELQTHGAAANGLIVLRRRIEFSLTNVTHRSFREDLRFTNPAWPGSLSELTRVERFDVGETKRNLTDWRDRLEFTEENGRRSYVAWIDFEPESSRHFVVEVLLLMDRSNNDIWASFYPTMKADVSVTALPELEWSLSINSTTPAIETHRSNNGLFARWEIDGPIMTHESIILWWRDVPDQAGPGGFASVAG